MKKTFYITTAIDYPSARFHLGHAYEKICTDIIARWKRLNGFKVHFSTGTDCHGLKIQRSAEKAGKFPLEFVTEISAGFKELCKVLNISYDDFVMTIENRHKKVAQYIINELYKNGDIYKGFYEGYYCTDCETYYTQKDLKDGNCPVHKKPVEILKEESYFFKLSKYQDFLTDYITKKPDCIWPNKKRNEILNKLKEPLRDLSISRKDVKWGIPLPFDKNLTEFVWVEALNNYLTTIGFPNKKYKDFWPAVHIIGVDIVFHHTVIWFSILKSLNLEIPRVVVHGFINLRGEKLSKAAGVNIDPIQLAQTYGVDGLRYFLIREIPFGEDGDFNERALVSRINNELANELGNLVSRTVSIAQKNFNGKIKRKTIDQSLSEKVELKKISDLLDSYELTQALNEIFRFIGECNKYINDKAPWNIKDRSYQEEILYNVLEAIRIISILISPYMPDTSEKIDKTLGIKQEFINGAVFGKQASYSIKKTGILFTKIK